MSTLTDRFHALWELFLKEVLKFGIVGGVAFILNATITVLLMNFFFEQEGHAKAKFIAGVVATIFSWTANRLWTFREKRQEQKWREAIQFAVVNLIGLGVETGCVLFTFHVLGLTSKSASFVSGTIIGTILGTILRYFAYRFWVYGNLSTQAEPEEYTREEQLSRFITEATEIITGSLDLDEIRRGARDAAKRPRTGPPSTSSEDS